jgi:hypothetical protein
MSEPSFWRILLGGLPSLLRESFIPVGVFYVGLRVGGLGTGIGLSALASGLVYLHERRRGRDALLTRLSIAFVAVQSILGVVADSEIAYLAPPVLVNFAWALAFCASAAAGRPLAGTFACAWYPFPPSYRATDRFRHVFGVESVVWGLYLLARSMLRLFALLTGTVGDFVAVAFVTGAPMMFALTVWSIRYAMRNLEPALSPAT